MKRARAAGGAVVRDPRVDLLRLSDRLGPTYGTEDFSVFIYSLIKMKRWKNLLKLGTGLGVSTFWMAQALAENGAGKVFSLDDGRHFEDPRVWATIREALRDAFPEIRASNYFEYLSEMSARLRLKPRLRLIRRAIRIERARALVRGEIDLVFSDFSHSPLDVLELLATFLPSMAGDGALFIDSASTHLASCLVLEKTVQQLNEGRVPTTLLDAMPRARARRLEQRVSRLKFHLTHLVENKDRKQNSTAWIQLEPFDFVPYPRDRLVL